MCQAKILELLVSMADISIDMWFWCFEGWFISRAWE